MRDKPRLKCLLMPLASRSDDGNDNVSTTSWVVMPPSEYRHYGQHGNDHCYEYPFAD